MNRKPILHIEVATQHVSMEKTKAICSLLKRIKDSHTFDSYDVIISPKDSIDLKTSNGTVVKLTIDENTNIEKLHNYIENIPKLVNDYGVIRGIPYGTHSYLTHKDYPNDYVETIRKEFYLNGSMLRYEIGMQKDKVNENSALYISFGNDDITNDNSWFDTDDNVSSNIELYGDDNIKTLIVALEDAASHLRRLIDDGGENNVTSKQ